MRASYINPFLNSTLNLVRSMLGEDAHVGDKYLLKHFGSHRWEISGVISLTGSVEGLIVIRLSRVLAVKLLEKSGVPFNKRNKEETSEMINEMVGELVNVIAGNALGDLNNDNIEISVPFVVQGKNHTIAWPPKVPIIVIPFATTSGPFEVTVSLKTVNMVDTI